MSEEREKQSSRLSDDDVEAHRRLKGMADEEGDEVEAHKMSARATDDPYGGDDDVEGHIKQKS
jgi:hypothetical protein